MGPQGSKRKVTVMILTCQSWYLNAFSLNPNLKIVALQRDTVVPRGHLTMSRDTFGCHKWGHRDFLGSPVVRTSPSKCLGRLTSCWCVLSLRSGTVRAQKQYLCTCRSLALTPPILEVNFLGLMSHAYCIYKLLPFLPKQRKKQFFFWETSLKNYNKYLLLNQN